MQRIARRHHATAEGGARHVSVRQRRPLNSSGSPPLGMRGHYIDTKQGHRRMSAVGVQSEQGHHQAPGISRPLPAGMLPAND